jgi:hypothetical protein
MTHAARGPEEGSGRLGAMILKPFSDSHGCGLVQVSSQNPHFRQYPPNLLDGPFVEGVRFQVTLNFPLRIKKHISYCHFHLPFIEARLSS